MKFLHRDSYLFEDTKSSQPRLVQIAFIGRGVSGVSGASPEGFGRVIGDLLPQGVAAAWVRQVHSADVLEAEGPGACGTADALVTRRPGLGLTVVTADCVPVLLAGVGSASGNGRTEPQIAAVHAGWRGVAADIVTEAASRFVEPPRTAWIGPAISGEVYEVGPEVAAKVADASEDGVVSVVPSGDPNGREHVDLRRAVEVQLRRAGVGEVRQVDRCTFRDDSLWSYRRDGEGAGRNLAVIWIEPV